MATVVTHSGRLVAVLDDDMDARYAETGRRSLRIESDPLAARGRPARALVELQIQHGGHAPRAIVGGEYIPGQLPELELEVIAGGSYDDLAASQNIGTISAVSSKLSPVWSFIAGLPTEFAEAALNGLSVAAKSDRLSQGTLRLDRAAFDERESSAFVFELAAKVLYRVLRAKSQDQDVESCVRAFLPLLYT